jgi:hypothetical protein
MKLFIFLYFPFAICFFDAFPPDPSELYDIRPKLTLNLSGFAPQARAYVRYWDGSQAYAFPSSYALYIDAGGRLQTQLSLSPESLTADVLVYVDENKNDTFDDLDFGFYQAGIVIDSENIYTTLDITWQTGTLTTYVTTATFPISGQKICVYMPPGISAYETGLNEFLPDYPDFDDVALTASDWFPVSILSTTSVAQNVPLLASWMTPSINETCIQE